jgi:hypothetical protein
MTDPSAHNDSKQPPSDDPDFYWDGPFMVFTEKFLRERGFCCQSGCRHCPYGFVKPLDPAK